MRTIDDQAVRAIKTRLRFNAKRVRNLLSLSETYSKREGSEYADDVVRSAVVFLHATLEDVLRGLLKWSQTRPQQSHIQGVPFRLAGATLEKISLGQLAKICGSAADDLSVRRFINETIRKHYDNESFGNVGEIVGALKVLGVDAENYLGPLRIIAPMMERRHHIVHQSDRDEPEGPKHGTPRPISKREVEAWLAAATDFLNSLIAALEQKTRTKARILRPREQPKVSVLPAAYDNQI